MPITDRAIDQVFSDLRKSCGGVRNDYFGLLYLEEEFGVARDRAIAQVAFGGNDYGVDGFHFDVEKRNLYLFQIKWSDSHALFKESFIVDKGVNKYAYVQRARNLLWALLCQAILNDSSIEDRAENFGRGLSLEAQYTDWLSGFATTRVRFILSDLVADKIYEPKAAEGNFSFMRTNPAYKRSMEIAYKRWRWVEKRLNRYRTARGSTLD